MRRPIVGRLLIVVWLVAGLAGWPSSAAAQYFGRNKVQYRTFDFQILKTEHFDLYYYPEEAEAAALVARMAERWHDRLSRFFSHELRGRQVVILYAVSAHFRQTNAIEGLIGEGTGGVTEGFRRRIVLPVSGSLAETDHVLGHELVHAFQFDLTGDDPRDLPASVPGILAYPLWFVEGMAEYLSLGPVDGQTAMWMRDAALREKLPHIRDLESPDYFPYRWGHAFWAYIGARYGDRTVASLIRSAANPRSDLEGLARQLGTDPDTLTEEWHQAILTSTVALTDHQLPIASRPRLVIGPDNGGGTYNVGPRVSPDGRRIVFFSERDRFSVDLFVADAETGKVERKLVTSATDPHFDSLQFLNSAGAWSPDGRQFAMAAVRGGRPVLALLDMRRGRLAREIRLEGLDDALHPAFAPDGQSVVLSGNAGGLVDLYRLSLATGALERLMSDPFADLEPVFTPDGLSIVFVTERFGTSFETLEPGPLRLARLDLATRTVRPIAAFQRGKQISPQVSGDGRSVTFVADPDGVSNLYRMPIDGGPVEQLTSLPTGVAGITASSPALSAAADGRLAFSVFEDAAHAIYILDPEDTISLVPPPVTQYAAVLPGRTSAGGDIQRILENHTRGLPPVAPMPAAEPYQRSLSLDMIGQPTVSGTVSAYGTRMTGGLSAIFSDMLGDRGLGVQAQIGGTFADFGGEILYINRRHRWNWAVAAVAAPQSAGYLIQTRDPATGQTQVSEVVDRQPIRGLFGTTAYPFSAATRLEMSGGVQSLSFTREIRRGIYDPETRRLVDVVRERVSLGDPLRLAVGSAALVHDTSIFGATGPIYGARSRLELGRTTGTVRFTTALADWRRYFMPVRPVTIAVRGLHYGRYGRDSEHDQLLDLYVGHPEFVHGYGLGSFTPIECLRLGAGGECDIFDNLIGSRMLVANLEVRAPLPGLFRGEIEYGRIPVDVVAFADAGVSWTRDDRPWFTGGSRHAVRSVGGAVRVNVFGLLAIEVAASRPFDRIDRTLQWQIGIRQGF
jgi:Tol biopolymer transport system component